MAEAARVLLEVGNDAVAVITLLNPPVNTLALPTLKEKYNEAMRRNDVKAIVLTGDGGKFCGGFDLNVFRKIHKTGNISILPDDTVELSIKLMEDAIKPSVAAIQGIALGGGLELAMACHARIATPNTQLGLPELSFGIIPAMAGTQRLPRLVGVKKSIEMLMTSNSISSEEGKKHGLVDEVVSPEELLKVSRSWALDIAQGRKAWRRTLHLNDKITETRETIMAARKQTPKNMPHYQTCLDVIEEGIVHGSHNACLKEAKLLGELVTSNTSKGLVHHFFGQRMTTKVPGVTDVGLKARQMKKVGVVGGGLMGSGIATSLLVSNVSVVLKEINSEHLSKGIKTVQGNVKGLVNRGRLSPEKAEKAIKLLKGVLDYDEFKDVDMVIEAVIEKLPLKQSIFSDIERICPKHCILATNTSTIDLNLIGERTESHDRIVGAHFFSPAHIMPLLEIVRTEKTTPQVILDLITMGKAMKKVPVVVGNCTGFAVNRNFFPYTMSAHLLVNLGVDLFRVDKVITDFGMPIGPFMLQDVSGYGVCIAAWNELVSAFPARSFRSPFLELLMESGRHGKANGKGYYLYEKGNKPKPDTCILPILEESRKITNVMRGTKPITVSDQELLEMVMFPVVNEACRVLDDRVVIRASDLDVASIVGMSFPSYRGGIVFWADTVGPRHVYESLKKWTTLYGDFFKPSRYLEERVAMGIPLSAPGSLSPASRSRI
ncbi:hypothetical protein V2J09_000296 [Rumex salicifolius]